MPIKDNSPRKPTKLDVEIGQRIRNRRVQLNISSGQLGKMLDITQQQIQKYETGKNRVNIGRLVQIASALNINTRYFVDGIETMRSPERKIELTKGHVDLLNAYARIKSPDLKKRLLQEAQTVAAKHRSVTK